MYSINLYNVKYSVLTFCTYTFYIIVYISLAILFTDEHNVALLFLYGKKGYYCFGN